MSKRYIELKLAKEKMCDWCTFMIASFERHVVQDNRQHYHYGCFHKVAYKRDIPIEEIEDAVLSQL